MEIQYWSCAHHIVEIGRILQTPSAEWQNRGLSPVSERRESAASRDSHASSAGKRKGARKTASSEEFVGEFWFRQLSKLVI